jgi:hypothetical protein
MIVYLIGGLGNQLFMYAFGRSVAAVRKIPLFFNRDVFRTYQRPYSLDAYNLDLHFSGIGRSTPVYNERGMPFDKDVYTAAPNSVFYGYWQTEKYFEKEIIRTELQMPKGIPNDATNQLVSAMSKLNSTFVAVRRGDYLTPSNMATLGCMSLNYYLAGMRYIEERASDVHFFIFSDDPNWCRENFRMKNCTVLDCNTGGPHWDIWLMSFCQHAVIANSSFSWWGAWLGDTQPNRIVISPKRWFTSPTLDSRDIVPERWIKLETSGDKL